MQNDLRLDSVFCLLFVISLVILREGARNVQMREKYVHVKVQPPTDDERRAQAANTTRLRGLRLAKEAADKDAVSRATVAQPRRNQAPPTC
jgi:hypothetical protein